MNKMNLKVTRLFLFLAFLVGCGGPASSGSGTDPVPDIETLPDGTALEATLDGEIYKVVDGDMTTYGSVSDYNRNEVVDEDDLPLSVALVVEESSYTINVTLYLTTEDIKSSLSINETYALGENYIGKVVLTPTSGSESTYEIKSAFIEFTTLEVKGGGTLEGDLQLFFTDSSDGLIAHFDGQFSTGSH